MFRIAQEQLAAHAPLQSVVVPGAKRRMLRAKLSGWANRLASESRFRGPCRAYAETEPEAAIEATTPAPMVRPLTVSLVEIVICSSFAAPIESAECSNWPVGLA
jgi:hypothetical protein